MSTGRDFVSSLFDPAKRTAKATTQPMTREDFDRLTQSLADTSPMPERYDMLRDRLWAWLEEQALPEGRDVSGMTDGMKGGDDG